MPSSECVMPSTECVMPSTECQTVNPLCPGFSSFKGKLEEVRELASGMLAALTSLEEELSKCKGVRE
jgi:hypothetical protein